MFIKNLKKNEVFFIDEEYVIFYELDPTNIFNDKRIIKHKSSMWLKHLDNLILEFSFFFYVLIKNDFSILNANVKDIWRIYLYICNINRKYVIKRNFFKRFYYHNVLTFNFIKKKLNMMLRCKDRLKSSITPGIITKKLGVEIKKYKKSTKIINIMVKSMLKTYRNSDNPHKLIIQIKGTKLFFFKITDFCKNIIKNYTDTYFIYTPVISNNNHSFKKLRSLKRNFRKKYFKE